MFKHNLLISYRSFLRNKSSFLINILGLSTGLACALFIFLWVQDEMGIDAFHENGDHLYQVMQAQPRPDGVAVGDWTPGPLADALVAELPEVKGAISVKYAADVYDGIIQVGERYIKARPYYVEDTFFNLFSYPLSLGDKSTVLSDKQAIVISEDLALKLFSSKEEAIGETVQWNKKIGEIVDFSADFTVTGVFDNKSQHSSDQFDILFNFEFLLEKSPGISLWANDQAGTYVLLNEGADVESLNEEITALVGSKREAKHKFLLQKFESRYLYNNYENGVQAGGKIESVWLFSIIAILILVIASINFMNLSTAKA
ncbi:MAG: ABC transporter permease, partial [Rhodothermales bacterium]